MLAGVFAGWMITNRKAQREWPDTQLRNAVALGTAISDYQKVHGSFPARLHDLVEGGILDQVGFQRLQFRSEPRADPEEWFYKPPDQSSDIAIVGPKAIFPWSGHSGYTVTARANGGGELNLASKGYRIPAWATQ